jgi:2-succinyl-6-hydroxy-2,4-cyclohexadiene-1-carboxylate synthase
MYRWHFTQTGNSPRERLPKSKLPPLILLHGWMGSCRDYAAIIELLKSRFNCIAIDLPGHGQTEVLDGNAGYEFINTAIGILQLLDSLGIDRTAIAGYSLGGRLALYLTLEFPHRFDRVMLESTSPGLATLSDRQARISQDREIIARLCNNNLPDFVTYWYHQPIFIGLDRQPNFHELIERRIAYGRPERLAKSLQYAGLGMQPYLGDRLRVYPQPIRLLVGALDRKFVALNQQIDRDCLTTSLKIVPNCSHNVHFSNPQAWIDCPIADEAPAWIDCPIADEAPAWIDCPIADEAGK